MLTAGDEEQIGMGEAAESREDDLGRTSFRSCQFVGALASSGPMASLRASMYSGRNKENVIIREDLPHQ